MSSGSAAEGEEWLGFLCLKIIHCSEKVSECSQQETLVNIQSGEHKNCSDVLGVHHTHTIPEVCVIITCQ